MRTIREFQRTHLSDAVSAEPFVRVNERLGGHPLALAALASAWREEGHRKRFWERALAALDHSPDVLLRAAPSGAGAGSIDKRHSDVLAALHFAVSLLDSQTRERFYDLVIVPSADAVDEIVFTAFWERIRRAGYVLAQTMQLPKRPLRQLERLSLVRSVPGLSGKYAIHEVHRFLLLDVAGGSAAQRHHEFLQVFGLLDAEGSLHVDNQRHFVMSENGRTHLRPDLPNADPEDVEAVGDYLLPRITYHIRHAEPDRVDALIDELLVSYRFLVALLGVPVDGQPPGNIRLLLAVLADGNSNLARRLLATVRLAGRILERDPIQLGGQLLARLRTGDDHRLLQLCSQARQWAPVVWLEPRRAFMRSEDKTLSRLSAPAGFESAPEIRNSADGLAVLAPNHRTIHVWAPLCGSSLLELDHGSSVKEARWCSDVSGQLYVLSWSGEQIAVWSGTDGKEIARFGEALDPVSGVSWQSGGESGPALLAWSQHAQTLTVFDVKRGLTRWKRFHPGNDLIRPGSFGACWVEDGPYGNCVLSWVCGPSTSLLISDSTTGEERKRITPEGSWQGASWLKSFRGRTAIMIWSEHGDVQVWDPVSGTLRAEFGSEPDPLSDQFAGRGNSGAELIEHNGAQILMTWSDLSRRLRLFDAQTTAPLAWLEHTDPVTGAQWLSVGAGGPVIMSWTDHRVYVWDTVKKELRFSSEVEGEWPLHAVWLPRTPGGPSVLTWRNTSSIVQLWDAQTGSQRAYINLEQEPLSSVQWIPEILGDPALLFASYGEDGAVELRSLRPGDQDLGKRPHLTHVGGVAWIGDDRGDLISWGEDGVVALWQSRPGTLVARITKKAAIRNVIAAGELDGEYHLLIHTYAGHAFAQPGESLTQDCDGAPFPLAVFLTSLPTGEDKFSFHDPGLRGIDWLVPEAGGPAILTYSSNAAARLHFRAFTEKAIGRPKADLVGASWLARDDGRPAVLTWDRTVAELWDPLSAQQIASMSHPNLYMAHWLRARSPHRIVTWSRDDEATVKMWDLHGAPHGGWTAPHRPSGVAWIEAFKGKPALLSWSGLDRHVYVFDPTSGGVRACLRHDATLDAAALASANGLLVVTATDRSNVDVWDLETETVLARFGLDSRVISLAIRERGSAGFDIAAGLSDGEVMILTFHSG